MKRNIVIIVLTALLSCHSVAAQDYVPAQVRISTEKVRLNGEIFYFHTVEEKQTLYSISKAYQVSIDDIYAANSALKETGLKAGSYLLIPVRDNVPASKEDSTQFREQNRTPAPSVKAAKEAEREIKAKEEKEKPAKSKSVKEEKAKEQPSAKENEVKEPSKKQDKAEPSPIGTRKHTVKWYEDIESIARKYRISTKDIIAANNLEDGKVKPRQVLLIPDKTSAPDIHPEEGKETKEIVEEPEIKVIPKNSETIMEKPDDNLRSVFTPKRQVNLCVMLPLKASSGSGNSNYMDFYSGVLLAAREKGMEGTDVDLSVYDTAADGVPVLSEERWENTDVVIGPVYEEEIGKIIGQNTLNVPVVSPMNPKCESLVKGHPNIIQAPTSSYGQQKDLVDWIKEDKARSDKVLVIYEKGSKETSDNYALNIVLKESGMDYSILSYSVAQGSKIIDTIRKNLAPGSMNRVIIASEKEAFVNDVCRNLVLLSHEGLGIILYGGSKMKSYETIETEVLHTLNLHISASYNVDYDNARVKDFIMKYRALYRTEPTAFAFQGYDLSYCLINVFSKYSNSWKEHLCNERYNMLQADFIFTGDGEDNGIVNKGVKRCIYGPEYKIRNIRR